ncbi:MAG TPA: GGDEF domain-containing protein [Gemmatimonadales bacterium]
MAVRRPPPFTLPLPVRRVLRLCGLAVLTGGVYLLNVRAPSELRVGILYLIPVLLAAWHDGIWWGVVFALATSLLRFLIGIDQMPAATSLQFRVANELAYLAVVGIAIAGLSQLRRTQAQLELLATRDPLTNVLNARAFSDELAQELGRNRRYGRPLALIYLDLDDFKRVNDAHGHATGDAVLRLVADAMRGALRGADIVGRLGGDEFAVLMPETDGDVAHAAALRLATGIRTVFRGTPSVTASIGVVSCTGTEAGTDELLRRADQAMYEAKRGGKDRVVQVAM